MELMAVVGPSKRN